MPTNSLFNSALTTFAISATDELGFLDELHDAAKVDVQTFQDQRDLHGPSLMALLEVLAQAGVVEPVGTNPVILTAGPEFDEVWLNKGSLVNALQASFALPGIFRPVQINGRWLIDGALVNPIPVSVCRALGARIVIAVNLSNDVFSKGAVIHDQQALAETAMATDGPELLGSNGRAAVHLLHRQIFGRSNGAPGMSAVMMDAIHITQDRIARSRLAGDPPDITIGPRLGDFGLFDFHRAAEAIELGARAAERQIDEIKIAVRALAA